MRTSATLTAFAGLVLASVVCSQQINLQAALGVDLTNVTKAVTDVTTLVTGALPTLLGLLSGSQAKTTADQIFGANSAVGQLQNALATAKSNVAKAPAITSATADQAKAITNGLISNAKTLSSTGKNAISKTMTSTVKSAARQNKVLGDAATTALTNLKGTATSLITALNNAIKAAPSAVSGALSSVTGPITELVGSINDALSALSLTTGRSIDDVKRSTGGSTIPMIANVA